MGYKLSPELMQLLCSTLAGVRSYVLPQHFATESLRIDIWIDNIRLCGEKDDVLAWGGVIHERQHLAGITLGESDSFTQQYTFIGV
eukprot:gene1424-gene1227